MAITIQKIVSELRKLVPVSDELAAALIDAENEHGRAARLAEVAARPKVRKEKESETQQFIIDTLQKIITCPEDQVDTTCALLELNEDDDAIWTALAPIREAYQKHLTAFTALKTAFLKKTPPFDLAPLDTPPVDDYKKWRLVAVSDVLYGEDVEIQPNSGSVTTFVTKVTSDHAPDDYENGDHSDAKMLNATVGSLREKYKKNCFVEAAIAHLSGDGATAEAKRYPAGDDVKDDAKANPDPHKLHSISILVKLGNKHTDYIAEDKKAGDEKEEEAKEEKAAHTVFSAIRKLSPYITFPAADAPEAKPELLSEGLSKLLTTPDDQGSTLDLLREVHCLSTIPTEVKPNTPLAKAVETFDRLRSIATLVSTFEAIKTEEDKAHRESLNEFKETYAEIPEIADLVTALEEAITAAKEEAEAAHQEALHALQTLQEFEDKPIPNEDAITTAKQAVLNAQRLHKVAADKLANFKSELAKQNPQITAQSDDWYKDAKQAINEGYNAARELKACEYLSSQYATLRERILFITSSPGGAADLKDTIPKIEEEINRVRNMVKALLADQQAGLDENQGGHSEAFRDALRAFLKQLAYLEFELFAAKQKGFTYDKLVYRGERTPVIVQKGGRDKIVRHYNDDASAGGIAIQANSFAPDILKVDTSVSSAIRSLKAGGRGVWVSAGDLDEHYSKGADSKIQCKTALYDFPPPFEDLSAIVLLHRYLKAHFAKELVGKNITLEYLASTLSSTPSKAALTTFFGDTLGLRFAGIRAGNFISHLHKCRFETVTMSRKPLNNAELPSPAMITCLTRQLEAMLAKSSVRPLIIQVCPGLDKDDSQRKDMELAFACVLHLNSHLQVTLETACELTANQKQVLAQRGDAVAAANWKVSTYAGPADGKPTTQAYAKATLFQAPGHKPDAKEQEAEKEFKTSFAGYDFKQH